MTCFPLCHFLLLRLLTVVAYRELCYLESAEVLEEVYSHTQFTKIQNIKYKNYKVLRINEG